MSNPSGQQTQKTTREDTDATSEEQPRFSKPDATRQFGKSYIDTGLKITVETPTVDTTFDYDGETYEMPDGEALAFVPVTFYNTLSEDTLPIDGPIFTLLGETVEVLETHSVEHPEFDPSIRVREIDGLSTTQRWTAQGGSIAPDERVSGTAVFRVENSIEPSGFKIAYESERIRDDRFGGTIVTWTE